MRVCIRSFHLRSTVGPKFASVVPLLVPEVAQAQVPAHAQ